MDQSNERRTRKGSWLGGTGRAPPRVASVSVSRVRRVHFLFRSADQTCSHCYDAKSEEDNAEPEEDILRSSEALLRSMQPHLDNMPTKPVHTFLTYVISNPHCLRWMMVADP